MANDSKVSKSRTHSCNPVELARDHQMRASRLALRLASDWFCDPGSGFLGRPPRQ